MNKSNNTRYLAEKLANEHINNFTEITKIINLLKIFKDEYLYGNENIELINQCIHDLLKIKESI